MSEPSKHNRKRCHDPLADWGDELACPGCKAEGRREVVERIRAVITVGMGERDDAGSVWRAPLLSLLDEIEGRA